MEKEVELDRSQSRTNGGKKEKRSQPILYGSERERKSKYNRNSKVNGIDNPENSKVGRGEMIER